MLLCRMAKTRGGKPMPNSSTRIPSMRALTKWPSSWITTSTPKTGMIHNQLMNDSLKAGGHGCDVAPGPRVRSLDSVEIRMPGGGRLVVRQGCFNYTGNIAKPPALAQEAQHRL